MASATATNTRLTPTQQTPDAPFTVDEVDAVSSMLKKVKGQDNVNEAQRGSPVKGTDTMQDDNMHDSGAGVGLDSPNGIAEMNQTTSC